MKVIVKNGKILVHNGKIVVGDECCDPCAKWWCVLGDNGETSCVQAATQPVGALSGPHDSQTICESVCSEFVWWCVFRNGVRQCVISDTEPIDKVPGTTGYPDSITCAAFCSSDSWWCVDNNGTYECTQSVTRPANAVHDTPYATEPECTAACSLGCGISFGVTGLPSPPGGGFACREWFDDCTGGTLGDCDGYPLPNAGYFMNQWDPADGQGGGRQLYATQRYMDLFAHGVPITIRCGVTIRNSNRTVPRVPPNIGGGYLSLRGWVGLNSSTAPNTVLIDWSIFSQPVPWLPPSPFGNAPNQWRATSTNSAWFPTTHWGILPITPTNGDRMEVEWRINTPSIAVGDTEFKTTYELINLRIYRGNAVAWAWNPFPTRLERQRPLCLGEMVCGGTGVDISSSGSLYYNAIACDDIYWDIQAL